MTDTRQQGTQALFDDEGTWRHEPHVAFLSLLKSETGAFLRTNIAKNMLPDGHRMREQSMLVYQAMFNKFLKHLEASKLQFLDASPDLVASFMVHELDGNTKDTAWRYLRLLERVYDHLVKKEVLERNPITEWVESRIAAGESPRVGRPSSAPPAIALADVLRLQVWMSERGRLESARGQWRTVRDLTLSALSLGAGMRCTELLLLRKEQVKHWPNSSPKDRFEFNIPGWASVATAKPHSTPAAAACVELMELWWSTRWTGFKVPSRDGLRTRTVLPSRELIFPGTIAGTQLDPSTLFRNLKRLGQDAVRDGVLTDNTRWVLARGAQGLRRAYAITELQRGADDQIVSFRMGLHRRQSIRRYRDPEERDTEDIDFD